MKSLHEALGTEQSALLRDAEARRKVKAERARAERSNRISSRRQITLKRPKGRKVRCVRCGHEWTVIPSKARRLRTIPCEAIVDQRRCQGQLRLLTWSGFREPELVPADAE